jgi:DNA-binding response OmpR family regulator
LIIDDDTDNLDILSLFFITWGWDVVGVSDTTQSLIPVPGLSLIVLDRALPGRSGVEVLRQLRDDGVTAPTVVVTGMPEDAAEDEFAGLGVEGIISKDKSYKVLYSYAKLIRDRPIDESYKTTGPGH